MSHMLPIITQSVVNTTVYQRFYSAHQCIIL